VIQASRLLQPLHRLWLSLQTQDCLWHSERASCNGYSRAFLLPFLISFAAIAQLFLVAEVLVQNPNKLQAKVRK
jgi:hypothetical protein